MLKALHAEKWQRGVMLRKHLERAEQGSLGNANGGLRELGSYKDDKQLNNPIPDYLGSQKPFLWMTYGRASGRRVARTLLTTIVGNQPTGQFLFHSPHLSTMPLAD